ncbi:hypothetical protein RSOLAG22IIIB_08221 [Rhizoctonia solani]|uniref:Uncharacterized protein n=1 Tax=Rhizoctonia solani TaxID=456999 RepID=A0A0K6FRZ2_9AGAM|nr:hypothetical protein RSOLAG22IIIB_08221 [Rhizoctonia solani]
MWQVTLKDDADMESHLIWLQEQKMNSYDSSSKCEVTFTYRLVKGYAAKLAGPVLVNLTHCGDVQSISQDRQALCNSPSQFSVCHSAKEMYGKVRAQPIKLRRCMLRASRNVSESKLWLAEA